MLNIVCNCPSYIDVLEKNIFKFWFHYFVFIILWCDFSFKQTWTPTPNNVFCKVWLKLAHWFVWRRYLDTNNLFLLLSALGNSHDPLFERSRIYITQGYFLLVKLTYLKWIYRRFIKEYVNATWLCHYYLPLDMCMTLHTT